MKHSELVELAAQWLRKKCPIVVTELATSGEEPDAIGWHGHNSILVECKTSREDFRADAGKPFRFSDESGIGIRRYFLALPGVIAIDCLPPKWGLLEVTTKGVRMIRESEVFEANQRQEIGILLSCLRRIGQTAPKGISIRCYTIETMNRATITLPLECEPER